MATTFKISINKPCLKKFESFNSTTNGGFCNSCQKEVIDFTQMSDNEIIAYFKESKGNNCGYFSSNQLKSYTETPMLSKKQESKNWFGILYLTLLSIVPTEAVLSQEKPATETIQKSPKDMTEKEAEPFILKGIVVDELGEYLFGATVSLVNSSIATTTDSNGAFTFSEPLKKGSLIQISYLGYATQKINIQKNNLIIKMNPAACMLMGDVYVNETYTSKPTFFQKIKNIFK